MMTDRFPATRLSVVLATGSENPDQRRIALDVLIRSYWKPVYKYLRLHWRADNEEAEDLTQGFFARAIDRDFLARYDPARAKFRTYLRTCLDGFVSNERQAAKRLKRGGAYQHVALDFVTAEGELQERAIEAKSEDPAALFHQEWVRAVFARAVQALEEDCTRGGREVSFALFREYDLEGSASEKPPTYAELGERHGLPETSVTNRLHSVRKRFREIVLDQLRQSAATDDEYRQEVRELLGIDPGGDA